MKNTACCYNTIFEEQDAVAEALHNTIEVADKQIKDAEKRSIMVIFGAVAVAVLGIVATNRIQ